MVEISITGNISEVNSNKRKRVGLSKSQKKAKADDGSSVASTSHELKQVGKYILHQRFLIQMSFHLQYMPCAANLMCTIVLKSTLIKSGIPWRS